MSNVLAAVLFVVGALIVSLAPSAASAGTQLSTGGGSANAGASFATSATVSLAGPDELNGFDVMLTYNPSVAVPTGVTLNSAWTIPLDAGTIGANTIHVAASRLGFCTGTCPLFTINWNAVGAGSFQISPASYVLTGHQSSAAGNLTQTSVSAGSVVVAGSGQSTATNTPVTRATNTPVTPATNTPVTPATSTPITPASNSTVASTATNTPVPPASTPATPAGSTGSSPTTAAQPAETATSAPASPVNETPGDGPTDPPPADSGNAAPPAPAAANPPEAPASPVSGGSTSSVGPSSSSDARIPLPPRSGNTFTAPSEFPWQVLGWGLIGAAALLVMLEYGRGRTTASRNLRFSEGIEDYFAQMQHQGKRRR